MSSTTEVEASENQAKTPAKINAFQFMMSSRHKVIGSNSPGKEKKDTEMKSPEMVEKTKKKLNKRKAVLEELAEKKGGKKRSYEKLLDEAADNHINKTLNKRAKRLKKMLAIIDDELKNSGEDGSDSEEIIIKIKTKKHRKPLIVDSENSSNADDKEENDEVSNESENMKENCDDNEEENKSPLKGKSGKSPKVPKVKKNENIPHNIEKDCNEKKNVNDAKIIPDKNNKISNQETKLIPSKKDKIDNIKNINKKNIEEQNKKVSKEETKLSTLKTNDKENIKNDDKGNNKTSEKEIKIDSSKKNKNTPHKKKTIKRSLSLKKNTEVEKSSQENNSDKLQNNNDLDFSDDEIFPSKKVEAKSNLKKNEDKKEYFSPRTWRMRVRLSEHSNDDQNSEDEKSENSDEPKDKQSENNKLDIEEIESEDSKETEELIIDDESPQKQITQKNNSKLDDCDSKKQVKLAPIFLRQQQKKMDKEALDAKKNFLYSGVPSKVKKIMTKSKSSQEPEYILSIFPKISHVQQRTTDEFPNIFWDLPKEFFTEKESSNNSKLLFDEIKIGSFTNCNSLNKQTDDNFYSPPQRYKNLKELVKNIKKDYPSSPVYKTFRLLYQKYEKYANKTEIKVEEPREIETPKRKRGRPKRKKGEDTPIKSVQTKIPQNLEMLMWTEKYKPQSQEEIIGNISSVQELKLWLESWITYSEDKSARRHKRSHSSDDFLSDSTTKDSDSLPQNLILLFGPLGSGKTSSIYGLCNELNINVIEINASSKRPGKKILADLQEATQSHQVKNTDSKSVNSFFQKKPDSQNEDDINKKLSLLLFEDVDIVFEDQDDNFISALTTLIMCSKRPIILTATDKNCPHLQKFVMQYTVINFNSLTSKFLSPWLQVLCLVEGVRADKNMIEQLVEYNKGDMRKIILQLQFWTQTGGDAQNKFTDSLECEKTVPNQSSADEEICVDDDSSDITWFNTENNSEMEDKNSNFCHQNCAESFIPYYERDKEGFKLSYPVNLEVMWWNIPKILNKNTDNFLKSIPNELDNENNIENVKCEKINKNENKSTLKELKTTADFLDSLVIADIIHRKLKTECYDEPNYNYWQTNPVDSLSLNQNFRMYSENYNTSLEISHWLVENNISRCHHLSDKKSKLDVNTFVPYFEELSWRSKRHKAMKELLNSIPTFSILDRRAICEDYQTTLRTISRTEHERSLSNSKRKNRFYHYLKNFNVHLNDSSYLLLSNTLATNAE